MAGTRSAKTREDGDPAILLGVLSAIETDSRVTQRKLSRDLGIALGLANAYLKRCVRKGWVKMGQVPMHRYAYYLTPQGFSEKARLTSDYLSWSLQFFRRAKLEATELFDDARRRGLNRFALLGCGDFAEVAVLSAMEAGAEIVGLLDLQAANKACVGKPVFHSIEAFVDHLSHKGMKVDGIMVTAAGDNGATFDLLRTTAQALDVEFEPQRIFLPKLLKLTWPLPAQDEEGRL